MRNHRAAGAADRLADRVDVEGGERPRVDDLGLDVVLRAGPAASRDWATVRPVATIVRSSAAPDVRASPSRTSRQRASTNSLAAVQQLVLEDDDRVRWRWRSGGGPASSGVAAGHYDFQAGIVRRAVLRGVGMLAPHSRAAVRRAPV